LRQAGDRACSHPSNGDVRLERIALLIIETYPWQALQHLLDRGCARLNDIRVRQNLDVGGELARRQRIFRKSAWRLDDGLVPRLAFLSEGGADDER